MTSKDLEKPDHSQTFWNLPGRCTYHHDEKRPVTFQQRSKNRLNMTSGCHLDKSSCCALLGILRPFREAGYIHALCFFLVCVCVCVGKNNKLKSQTIAALHHFALKAVRSSPAGEKRQQLIWALEVWWATSLLAHKSPTLFNQTHI